MYPPQLYPGPTIQSWSAARRAADRELDDKAGQVQSHLCAGGTKIDVENTPKCTRLNCILTRRSSLGPPPVEDLVKQIYSFLLNQINSLWSASTKEYPRLPLFPSESEQWKFAPGSSTACQQFPAIFPPYCHPSVMMKNTTKWPNTG